MAEFEPNKFIVLKQKDAANYLSLSEQRVLTALIKAVDDRKTEAGEESTLYLVHRMDEPYAEEVLKLILEHKGEKNGT